MVTLYAITSLRKRYRYVGITENLTERLAKHANGECKSTKGRGPFKLVHTEKFSSYVEARKREVFLKSGVGRKYLDNITVNK